MSCARKKEETETERKDQARIEKFGLTKEQLLEIFNYNELMQWFWMNKSRPNHSLKVTKVKEFMESYPDTKQMKEWERFRERAAYRDHRKMGVAKDLFFMNSVADLHFFTPYGTHIYNNLFKFIRIKYHMRGFKEVISPSSDDQYQIFKEFDKDEEKNAQETDIP
uniref:Uncharacterized protein n=1 Tax=Tetranychus urticae TaxID=32264 RepID=T1L623_TETUR